MKGRQLILRCDASMDMGTGHAMRCLALAHAWQDEGGVAIFAMAEPAADYKQLLVCDGFQTAVVDARAGSLDDARQVIALARKGQVSWVVIDGYQFSADYQNALKAEGLKVLWVDDNGHAQPYSADFVLNQNIFAKETMYKCREPHTRLLLGPRFSV